MMHSHWVMVTTGHTYETKIPQAEAERIATAIDQGSIFEKHTSAIEFSTAGDKMWRVSMWEPWQPEAWVSDVPQNELIKMLLDFGPIPDAPTNSTPGVWSP